MSLFVDSCVGYTPNVKFFGAQSFTAENAGNFLLILGTELELAQHDVLATMFGSLWSPEVRGAIMQATSGKLFSTTARLASHQGSLRLFVGVVPSVASRHNCPTRPDSITSLVQDAVSQSVANLSVVSLAASSAELCVAAAIAKGAVRSFSAKGGRFAQGCLLQGIALRVFFKTPVLTSRSGALEIVAKYAQLCQRLVDAPTNLLDTVTFGEIASCIAGKVGAKLNIISGEELREKGYGGLYNVGKAAEYPPALVTLSYSPKQGIDPQRKIALVGKGLVYDTGGLALKTPATGMCSMKHDMGGAAAVMCGFFAAVELEAELQLSCTLCLADNAVGPRSFRNDDILILKSGITVEVNNTDAEGRLVLSDGVYHASALLDFTPDVLIDMATLTGAQGIATGKRHAALFTNSGEWESRMCDAGRASGDLCFPIVYCPEFHNPEFASKVADYRNSVANRSNAQSSCAGQFIGNSLASDFKGAWIHVDLASPATCDEGTGYGVALLIEVFGQCQSKSLIN